MSERPVLDPRGQVMNGFPPVQAGEWIRPPLDEPFLMKCCDCGLVHALRFAHDTDGRIMFAAWRVNEAGEIEDERAEDAV